MQMSSIFVVVIIGVILTILGGGIAFWIGGIAWMIGISAVIILIYIALCLLLRWVLGYTIEIMINGT